MLAGVVVTWRACPEPGCIHGEGHMQPHSWGPFATRAAWESAQRASIDAAAKRALQAELNAAAEAIADLYPCRTDADRIAWRKALDRLVLAVRAMRGEP